MAAGRTVRRSLMPIKFTPCKAGGAHHWLLEETKLRGGIIATPGTCKKCGQNKRFRMPNTLSYGEQHLNWEGEE